MLERSKQGNPTMSRLMAPRHEAMLMDSPPTSPREILGESVLSGNRGEKISYPSGTKQLRVRESLQSDPGSLCRLWIQRWKHCHGSRLWCPRRVPNLNKKDLSLTKLLLG